MNINSNEQLRLELNISRPAAKPTRSPSSSHSPYIRFPSAEELAKMISLSEESKERIGKLIDLSRVAIHYGYLPMILYLGYTRSEPKPSWIKLLSPLS
ncbi:Mitochondrial outer membrane translocase complex subunitt Tom7 [Zalerion maritima]|uniref:Mitochondrial outer membrane translocase complex subunitt Tom7 n=1 Tax=Zalerion maritima TaxID=339359 RepID=A0AAD5RS32_9PEZI|nr:Mitochondrial outer membrane translocase complex subunitt Tom7 [Zalerion maritima]